MFAWIRREALYVLSGFVVTFLIYLYIVFDADEVTRGLGIGLLGGAGVAILIFVLERWVPGRGDKSGGSEPVE